MTMTNSNITLVLANEVQASSYNYLHATSQAKQDADALLARFFYRSNCEWSGGPEVQERWKALMSQWSAEMLEAGFVINRDGLHVIVK